MNIKILFIALFIFSSNVIAKQNILNKENSEIFWKEKNKTEIISPLTSTADIKTNTLTKFMEAITFKVKDTQILPIPILETSKDLGANYGIMPVMAFKDNKDEIKNVIAPSINYNNNIGKTFSYRHYCFPYNNSIIMGRASISDKAQKEFIIWHYNQNLFNKNIKVDFQILDTANPKFSFYGYGPDSSSKDRANYIFYSKGGELNMAFPLGEKIYINYTTSYYIKKIKNGIVNSQNKFSEMYPLEYQNFSKENTIFKNNISAFIDTTNHPFLPQIGNFFILSAGFSRKSIFSDYNFTTYSIESKKYYNYGNNKKYVTAIRYLLQWQTGSKIPFYEMSQLGETIGLRMAGDGRFTDKGKIVANIEQRITVSKSSFLKFVSEFEITPFLDIGTVFNKFSKISTGDLNFGPGIAFRLVLRPQVVATLDFSYGNEGLNCITKVGYPF